MSHQKAVKTTLNDQANLEARNTEVVPQAKRRQFSLAYKKRILTEVDGCNEAGQIAAVVFRNWHSEPRGNRWHIGNRRVLCVYRSVDGPGLRE